MFFPWLFGRQNDIKFQRLKIVWCKSVCLDSASFFTKQNMYAFLNCQFMDVVSPTFLPIIDTLKKFNDQLLFSLINLRCWYYVRIKEISSFLFFKSTVSYVPSIYFHHYHYNFHFHRFFFFHGNSNSTQDTECTFLPSLTIIATFCN